MAIQSFTSVICAAAGSPPQPPTVTLAASYELSEFVGIDEEVFVDSDGDLRLTVISTVTSQANAWVDNADKGGSYGSDFETRLTKNSGDDPISGDTVGSWLTINTGRTWAWGTGSTYNFTLEIREIAAPGTNIDSTTISQF
jgi:hypothetical protein